jgi:hypothetical protein
MKINSCWIKISFSSNPESFQIFADEIVNSSMFKSRDFTKKRLNIPKGNPNPYIEDIVYYAFFKMLSGYDIYA